jgi:hypothetical protein
MIIKPERVIIYGFREDRFRIVEAAGDWLDHSQRSRIETCPETVECIIVERRGDGPTELRFRTEVSSAG